MSHLKRYNQGEQRYPSGVALWTVLIPVTIAYFLFFLDTCIVATASPAITAEFNSLADLGWYGGAYQLGNAAIRPLTGKLFSQFNTKFTFLTFFIIFELGSVIAGAATSSAMFIVGRAIAGAGAAGISTGALAILASVLPPHKQAKALGINMGIGQSGIALGPIIGGAFTTYVSWRWCFYINLPLGALFLILLLLSRIPEVTPKLPPRQIIGTAMKSLDLPGIFLIAPAAILLLLGLQWGGTRYSWSSSVVIGLIIGGLLFFVAFFVWEYRQKDEAMIPMALLKNRIIWSAAATLFFLLASVLVSEYYLAMYFQTIHDNSPLMSGVHILPTTLGLLLFAVLAGTMSEKFGYYLPWILVGAAISAIGYGLMSTFTPTTPVPRWIGYQILFGAGSGAMVSIPYIAVQNCVPATQIPIAMTIVLFCQDIGAATWLVAANAIFNNGLRLELQQRTGDLGIDPETIVQAGEHRVRELLQGDALVAALECFNGAISQVFYLGIALALVTLATNDLDNASPTPSYSSSEALVKEKRTLSDASSGQETVKAKAWQFTRIAIEFRVTRPATASSDTSQA
ncbi:hypothetical protein BU24DRAFT_431261 [Aaosphaeria arxii CBS 175.79]|uniref:Major facilitator superfamily (MFS) profile domain-containing protein n=1 Tax=Aaosphaeria arxii CBS 175.79 TaxID=1450172 RepID=A0A6A5Y3N3_9PLEO|nr:uncharacterized protein BU24DRAFT_431261 [Aaosphaeria arxii CBS 175.79]KAF2019471.1 hypothetical protein BU24DRAFT_431261 [Aaosphaeria arxii CBS 175.79]